MTRMKAEERKALETNTLANTIGNLLQKGKEGISRNALIVVGAIVLVIVLVYTWRYFAARSQALNAQLWLRWDNLGDPDTMAQVATELEKGGSLPLGSQARKEVIDLKLLEKFSTEHPGTVQGRMARFQRARLALYDGLRSLGRIDEREQALERLKTAADEYDKLIQDSRDVPLLYQEALLNCGKANEALGQIPKALTYYKRLHSEFPNTELGKTAGKEVTRLEKEDKKDVEDLAKDLVAPAKS
jgi:tetratricopeptide (TPR) repeat protein